MMGGLRELARCRAEVKERKNVMLLEVGGSVKNDSTQTARAHNVDVDRMPRLDD